MSVRAWLYVTGAMILGLGLGILPILGTWPAQLDGWALAQFVLLATAAQLYTARAPSHQSYHVTLVFFYAGLLILPPVFFLPLAAIPHAIELAKERWVRSPRLRKWYLQPFNVSTHLIAMFAARWILEIAAGGMPTTSSSTISAMFLASIAYLAVNHLMVGLAIMLARGISLKESAILSSNSLLSDWILLLMGISLALLWMVSPWLIFAAVSPLLLMYQALQVPGLSKEAATDAKTGLLNARQFNRLFTAELERAERTGHSLSLIMADVDLLRNINNTYGHLAGDAVLTGVSQVIRSTVRERDLAGRFGGEEFIIALPEADLGQARVIAERLRKAVHDSRFETNTYASPLHATLSLGISSYPDDGGTPTELVHMADVAVYQAKLLGRNQAVAATDLPDRVKIESATVEEKRMPGSAASPLPSLPAPPAVTTRPARGTPGPHRHAEAEEPGLQTRLSLFVASVIALGLSVAVLGFAFGPRPDTLSIGFLVLLALLTQLLQVKNVYGETSVSVSMAVNFAAALLAGLPGVVLTSAAIAVVHFFQRRPAVYKTAFNWSVHLLAGTVPSLILFHNAGALQGTNILLAAGLAIPAALAYYAIDTGLYAVVLALSGRAAVPVVWRERYQWLAPHYLMLSFLGFFLSISYAASVLNTLTFLIAILVLFLVQRQYVARTSKGIQDLQEVNEELARASHEATAASQTIRMLNDELLSTLAKIIDARDPYVSGHSSKVAEYASSIAAELGLPPERVEDIRRAAFLHDIGKIGISESVLHKPSRLDPDEYEYVKTHAALGAGFLETGRALKHLADFVKYHHERFDGTGYPERLRGQDIPLEARILSVCDAVESMASDRPYHKAMGIDEIIREIQRCAGTQFDPDVVKVCVRVLRQQSQHVVVNPARTSIQRDLPRESVKSGAREAAEQADRVHLAA